MPFSYGLVDGLFNSKHLFCYTSWFILAHVTQRYKTLERYQRLNRKWYLPCFFIATCITCVFHWHSFCHIWNLYWFSEIPYDVLITYQILLSGFHSEQPNFCVLLSVQILPNPPSSFCHQHAVSTPDNVQAAYNIWVLMFWASDIMGPLCSRHFFPSTFSSSYRTPLPNMISSFSLASVSANPSACSFLFAKSEPIFQHNPPLGKNFTCPCQEIDKIYQVKLFLPPCCGLFLFPFNDIHCSKILCRSRGFKGWSLVLSLSWKFCVRFCKLLWLLLCQIYLDDRSLKPGYLLLSVCVVPICVS